MTQRERPHRGDRPASAAPLDAATEADLSQAANKRLLIFVLVVLIVVLCVVIAVMLRTLDKPPIGPDAGPEPQPLLSILGPGKGADPRFVRPLSAAWAPNGEIYVSDTGNDRICVFSSTGRFKREFGRPKSSKPGADKGALQQPAGIAVGPDGHVYVADVRAGAVVVFDKRGRFVKRMQPRGTSKKPKRHWTPTDVAVAGGKVFVTDSSGVAILSADGSLEGRIDKAGATAFAYPNGVAVRPNGELVVSDTNNSRVVSVEESGTLLWVATSPNAGRRVVGLPRGLSVAQDGSILVADAFLFGLKRFTEKGILVQGYGARGSAPGQFEFPNDADVRGDLVLVADKENNRVQIIQWPGLTPGTPK